MKFNFDSMTCKNVKALERLLEWVNEQPYCYDNEDMTVFVDSEMDFCAVEYVSKPFQHTSRAHSLMDCIVGRYVPCVVPLSAFRQKVFDLVSVPRG